MLKSDFIRIVVLVTALACGEVVAQDLPDSQYYDSNGIRIHCIEQGSGETIILLHGNTGSVKSWTQSGIFQNLAKDYRVIAFDSRGHGKSDKPHDLSAYGAEMSQDIIRLLDHLHIEKAHIVGSSMGARILGKLMTTHANRFLTAIIIGSAPSWNWTANDQRAVEERSENRLNNPSQRLLEQGQDIQALATLLLGFSELAVTDQELRNVQIPTLAIIGNEDRNLPRVNNLKSLMPDMKIVIIDGVGHGLRRLVTRDRAKFIAAARAFIADHSTEH